jgi:hypothetical protein
MSGKHLLSISVPSLTEKVSTLAILGRRQTR